MNEDFDGCSLPRAEWTMAKSNAVDNTTNVCGEEGSLTCGQSIQDIEDFVVIRGF